MKYYLEEDELYPVYQLFAEPAPENEEPRLEVEVPEELAQKYSAALEALYEVRAELREIVEPIKEAADWPPFPSWVPNAPKGPSEADNQ